MLRKIICPVYGTRISDIHFNSLHGLSLTGRRKKPCKLNLFPDYSLADLRLTTVRPLASPSMALATLPPEITQEILTYLPISSLLSFSETSRTSHALALPSLRTLSLGVFNSRVNGLIAFMNVCRSSTTYDVSMVVHRGDIKTKQQIIRQQNCTSAAVLRTHGSHLRDLELAIWEIEKPVAEAMASMKNLRRLNLNLDHPHTRHSRLLRSYWDEAPTGTVWNLLAASASGQQMFGRLESVVLQRAGVTDYQLKQILKRNPHVKGLKLHKCFELTRRTFDYLARSPLANNLEILHFTSSHNEEVDERIFAHIPKLTALKVSFCCIDRRLLRYQTDLR